MDKFTAAANIAFFLLERKGTIYARWTGLLTAAEQRALIGCVVGKGLLTIDGNTETITHTVSVGFGGDYEETAYTFANVQERMAAKAEDDARRKALREARKAAM